MPTSWDDYPLNFRPATETDIFTVFEAAAKSCGFYEAKNGMPRFGPEMTLHDWLFSLDEFYSGPLQCGLDADWLNETYQASIDKQAWDNLTRNPKKVTIGEICSYIVENGACILDHKPVCIAGRNCDEAGAFLAFTTSLKQGYGRSPRVLPSTPINRAARIDKERFGALLFITCPQLSDKYHIWNSWPNTVLIVLWYVIWLLGLVNWITSEYGYPLMSLWTWISINLSIFISILATVQLPPRRIEIEGLETMADLSREIVKYRQSPVMH